MKLNVIKFFLLGLMVMGTTKCWATTKYDKNTAGPLARGWNKAKKIVKEVQTGGIGAVIEERVLSTKDGSLKPGVVAFKQGLEGAAETARVIYSNAIPANTEALQRELEHFKTRDSRAAQNRAHPLSQEERNNAFLREHPELAAQFAAQHQAEARRQQQEAARRQREAEFLTTIEEKGQQRLRVRQPRPSTSGLPAIPNQKREITFE